MIRFPKSWDEAVAYEGEYRAGGTDLQERRHQGLAAGDLVDLRDTPGLRSLGLDEETGEMALGARLTLGEIARHPELAAGWPALTMAADGIATAQIRNVATLGGNLLQRVRCWYFKDPGVDCLKTGGSTCPARDGDHINHACFDLGPCVAPHPSTLAMALLTYDAEVEIFAAADRPEDYEPPALEAEPAAEKDAKRGGDESPLEEAAAPPIPWGPVALEAPYDSPWGTRRVTIAALMGDGRDATRENTLGDGELLVAVHLPPAEPGELAAWFRMMSRASSEWPIAEASVRLKIEAGAITLARVAVTGVATIPLRLEKVEAALEGQPATPETLEAASALASEGARPLPMNGYKLPILEGVVLEALEMALSQAPPEALPQPAPEEGAEGDDTEETGDAGEEG